MAVAYSEVITKYVEKDYIRKVEPSEKQPMQKWYVFTTICHTQIRLTTY